MIKAAESPRYLVSPHSVSIWNVIFFPLSLGLFYSRPVISAVTTSLLIKVVIKPFRHARQLVLTASDKQV